jgi:drug/metabolite transporter (DMT)-like permease
VKNSNALLFAVPTLIWGSTYYVIKFQIGIVDPLWSVSYRFLIAGLILLSYCKYKKIDLYFSGNHHLRILLQASMLFGFNYWFVYIAELELTSGLVAVSFSGIIFLNILFGRIFLGKKTTPKVYIGALFGMIGTALLFYEDLGQIAFEDLPVISLILCFSSVVIYSLGNIIWVSNQARNMPILQTNAFAMLYAGLLMAVIGSLSGSTPGFILSFEYVGSLLYLAVFGSIIAFGGYLTLIGTIGADRAAYVNIVTPIIAVALSVGFESYRLSALVSVGMILILLGIYIMLKK